METCHLAVMARTRIVGLSSWTRRRSIRLFHPRHGRLLYSSHVTTSLPLCPLVDVTCRNPWDGGDVAPATQSAISVQAYRDPKVQLEAHRVDLPLYELGDGGEFLRGAMLSDYPLA